MNDINLYDIVDVGTTNYTSENTNMEILLRVQELVFQHPV